MSNKTFKHRFDTWAEFMHTVQHGKRNPQADNSSDDVGRGGWSGTETFQQAIDYLHNGWTDGITRIRELQKSLPSDLFNCVMPVEDYKPELRHVIAGGIIDVPAAITEASPNTFIQEVTPHDVEDDSKVRGRRLLTVYYNVTNNANMPADAFFYRGAYTFLMIEHMEACGYSVELWAMECCTGYDNNKTRTYIKVKEFGELFDSNKLAIALSSQFMLRRFQFRIQEQGCDEEVRTITNNGYGSAESPTLSEIVLPEDMDRNPMWIAATGISDKDKMLKMFRKHLDDHMNGHLIWDTQ